MIHTHIVVNGGEWQKFDHWTVKALVDLGVIEEGETCITENTKQTYYRRVTL